jgi:hypothetical protein
MPTPLNTDEAYGRLTKGVLRKRALDQFLAAIKRDIERLPKENPLRLRSQKVLDYMRGYIEGVDNELAAAVAEYEETAYKVKRSERRSKLKSGE